MTAILAFDHRTAAPPSQARSSADLPQPNTHSLRPIRTSTRLVDLAGRRDSPIWSKAGVEPARSSDPVDFVFGVAAPESGLEARGPRVAHLVLAGIASDSIDVILGDGTDAPPSARRDHATASGGAPHAGSAARLVC